MKVQYISQQTELTTGGQQSKKLFQLLLIGHADSILGVASNLLQKYQENEQNSVRIVAKIGLLYWWYQTVSHPAELTAGYYNTAFRDGYDPSTSMLSRHGAALQISCFEKLDNETLESFLCSPEGLLQQIRTASKKRVVELTGRNTHERFDEPEEAEHYWFAFLLISLKRLGQRDATELQKMLLINENGLSMCRMAKLKYVDAIQPTRIVFWSILPCEMVVVLLGCQSS